MNYGKWFLYFFILIALASFGFAEKKPIKIFLAGDSTMSIKEPRAFPETGWGMPFAYMWDNSVTVINRAKNGRSTKTFISEGLWRSIAEEITPGDYVFIQFGHNDESKEKTERYTTPEEYKSNHLKFINETREKGGIPVLITPVSRRRFDKEGIIQQTHELYSKLVREIAAEQKLILFDLDTRSRQLYQQFGQENSKLLFLQLKPGEHPNYPEGKNDNTHFSELGARLIAQIVLDEIKKQVPELAERIARPKPATDNDKSEKKFIVAKDGTGQFKTVQSALDAIPEGNKHPFIIYVKNGTYKEVVVVDARKNFVRLVGEDKNKTIISFDNHAGTRLPNGDTLNTWTCASFFVYGNDFNAENISFENNAGFNAGQAVALRIEGNRASFRNCRMTGFQDVLFLSGSGVKHYFTDCYIEGTTDFIFGAATAVFKNCHIHSKKNSHITAASTNSIIPFGFVFFDCRLTADSNVNKVSLGRPWSPTASVTYINCWMGNHIIPEGWNNWKNPANELTARYAEFKSSGPGANPEARVKWGRQLSAEEVKKFSIKNILGNWNPE
jgi:pectinesterase